MRFGDIGEHMRLSLGVVLALSLAGLQFIAVLLVVMSSFFSSERALLEHARSLLSDVAVNTIEHSKGFLQPARGAAQLATRLAENRIVSSDNPDLLEKLLFQQLRTESQFAGVFYGNENGDFVYVMKSEGPAEFRTKIITQTEDGRTTDLIWRDVNYDVVETRDDPEDTYDPRARPWYNKAKDQARLVWTEPYIFFTSQKPGITVASPVYDSIGQVSGVIGVDIEIDAISQFLSALKVGTHGQALILNRNGDVIAHPNTDLIKTRADDGSLRFLSIDEIKDPIARSAFSGIASDGQIDIADEISATFVHDGIDFVSTLRPIQSDTLPWTIAVYAPEDDFTSEIKRNRLTNIIIAAAVAALTALLGLYVARGINRPIQALALRATRISQGTYDTDEPFPKTFRELESANETMTGEIARRKSAELEYARTFDLASRGMAQIAPQTGTFLRVNKRLCELCGFNSTELRTMTFNDLIHPDDRPVTVDDASEVRLRHKFGDIIWAKCNAIPIFEENGALLHNVVTFDDVTDVREADAQIAKLNSDLAHNARMNTMGEMAAGIAHELNQPLTAITQNADAALLTAKDHSPPDTELVEILEELEGQAHRAADIIRALRGFVRKDGPSKSAIDLRQLVRQTVRLVQAEAKDNGVEIRIKDADVPEIIGIRVQIAQVIVNLLRNAIESIAATKDNAERSVTISLDQDDAGAVVMRVEDTGGGIDPNINLFSQFETTKPDGMGLGLSISRGIMEKHDGALWHEITSRDNVCFCCSFPVGAAQ